MPKVAKAKETSAEAAPPAPAPATAPAKTTKRKSTPKKKAAAPPQPKVMHLNGVPYLVLDKGEELHEVYAYKPSSDTNPLVLMGSYNPVSKGLLLAENWKQNIQESLAMYRKALKEKAEDAMDKAYELQDVPNPKHST